MTVQTIPQFSLVFKPQYHTSSAVECYELSVPRHLHNPVAEYLQRQGCSFRGRWSWQRNRSEFYIELILPSVLKALAERTLANGGVVELPQEQLNSNPIGVYASLLNDGQVETLERLWTKLDWTPPEGDEFEDLTYEVALSQTAMYLNDIRYPLVAI